MSEQNELKPCPICGSDEVRTISRLKVLCNSCGLPVLLEYWNSLPRPADDLTELQRKYPRAMKLMQKGAEFMVVKCDEPYAPEVAGLIRQTEQANGTWTNADSDWVVEHVGSILRPQGSLTELERHVKERDYEEKEEWFGFQGWSSCRETRGHFTLIRRPKQPAWSVGDAVKLKGQDGQSTIATAKIVHIIEEKCWLEWSDGYSSIEYMDRLVSADKANGGE
jgi:hypothetical protein